MIDVITKIICSLLCGLTITYCCVKISDIKYTITNYLISSILISVITYITYQVNYISELLILKLIISILIIKIVFKLTPYKSIIIILITMILMSAAEILSGLILIKFITIKEARSMWYFILLCNVMICLVTITIFKIKLINNLLVNFINKTETKNKLSTIVIFGFSVTILVYLFYNISINYGWNEKYIINIIIMISYIIIAAIFFKDKLEYNFLEEKYDALFDYFSELAENIDDLNLTTHEYKNQIAIVGNYLDNREYKEARKYIDDISSSINKDEGLLVNLKDIPKGGLKGLLYYKIVVAKNQKVEIVLDAGKNIKALLLDLSPLFCIY